MEPYESASLILKLVSLLAMAYAKKSEPATSRACSASGWRVALIFSFNTIGRNYQGEEVEPSSSVCGIHHSHDPKALRASLQRDMFLTLDCPL